MLVRTRTIVKNNQSISQGHFHINNKTAWLGMRDIKELFFVEKVCYNWLECILGVTFRYKVASIALKSHSPW